jgi:hypothetical protein
MDKTACFSKDVQVVYVPGQDLINDLLQISLREMIVQDIEWENHCASVIKKVDRKLVTYFNELTLSRILE